MMTVYHLSHTDLDGYSCQLVSSQFFDNIKFFNANYGEEVRVYIEQIVNLIRKEDKSKKIYFFITDLNLTDDESKWLNREYKLITNLGYDLSVQLLDHHKTGLKSSQKYDWYYLDVKRSATKIIHDFLNEHFTYKNKLDKIDDFVTAVNAVDLWIENDTHFEFGKTCMSMMNASNSINKILFPQKNRDFKYFLLHHAIDYVDQKDGHILLDDKIHFLKKEFLSGEEKKYDTLENLKADFIAGLIEQNKEKFTIYFKGKKGLMTYSLGSISIPANTFLKRNPDYDFFLDLNKSGTISLRADGKFDVSEFAALIADGGGHKNAAGGRFHNFKEVYRYDNAREFIEEELEKYQ
jgi:oligoribonuclease NrnB/cAMP/cGMP phosphodiesterase (DHH superfamily)